MKIRKIRKSFFFIFFIVLSLLFSQCIFNTSVFADDPVVDEPTYAPLPDTKNQSAAIKGYTDSSTSGLRSSQTLEVVPSGFASNAKFSFTYKSSTSAQTFDVVNGNGNWDVPVRLHKALQQERQKQELIPTLPTSGVNLITKIANGIKNLAIAAQNYDIIISNLAIDVENAAIRITNSLTEVENSLYQESYKSTSSLFRIWGTSAYPYPIEVLVTDTNPLSSTYGKSTTVKYTGFVDGNLGYDTNTSYAMLVGESMNVDEVIASSGIANADETNQATISNVTLTDVEDSSASFSDNKITASNVGLSTLKFTITKFDYAKFHTNQSANAQAKLYVFKKPTITLEPGTITLTNTQNGVIYSIGERKVVCSKDNEKIIFNKVANNYTYDLVLTKEIQNAPVAKKHIEVKTIDPYYGYLHYEQLKNVQNINNLEVQNPGDLTTYPIGPYAPGFVLENWYDEPSFDNVHDFKTKVYNDFNLYGKWDALKSSLNLTLLADNSKLTGAKVDLYQNGTKVFSLKESTAGVYSIKDSVKNGTYQLYINDVYTNADITPFTNKTAKDITSTQLKNRLSGDTLKLTVKFNKLTVDTYVDGVKKKVENTKIEFYDSFKFIDTFYSNGSFSNYFIETDETEYDVYYNSIVTNPLLTLSKNNKVGIVNFNTIKVTIKSDDSTWSSNNVSLRTVNGVYVASLIPGNYNTSSKSREYTTVLLDDVSETPTKYYIYVDGVNTEEFVTSTTDGRFATLSFNTVKVSLTENGEAYDNAEIRFTNDKRTYSITDNTNGLYATHLLDSGDDYTYKIVGAIDSQNHTVSSKPYNATHNYYSVEFMTSSKDGDEATYNETLYRTYNVLDGEYISVPSGAYFPGLAFVCWNETEYEEGEAKQISSDFSLPITSKKIFYAHFKNASVDINGFVRCDENGINDTEGDNFIMPNITITGYDSGNVISGIKAEFTNIISVKFKEDEDIELVSDNTPTSSDGYSVFNGDSQIAIQFDEKVSAASAAEYLRSIIVTPNTSGDCEVKFTSSDSPISIYVPADWQYTPETTTETYTKIESGSTTGRTLSSGNYYIANDASFSCANGNGLTINDDVKIYIPDGVTLTATGASGIAWNNPGKAAILLTEDSTLTVVGKGSLKATGGNATNGSKGGTGGGAWIGSNDTWNHVVIESAGSGGNGGAGAGAGVGTNGGNGGTGGAGGSGRNGGITKAANSYNTSGGGQNGSNGTKALNCGDFYAEGIALAINGGSGGAGGGAGGTVGGSAGRDTAGRYWYVEFSNYYGAYYYVATSSAGGGGGGGGYNAKAVGNGGTGGGGGGGGATGGYTCIPVDSGYVSKRYANAWGGLGGAGYANGANDSGNGHSNDTFYNHNRGTGGTSDNSGKEITASQYTQSTGLYYKVTFDESVFGCNKTEETYPYFTNKNIVAPALSKDIEGIYFKGWQVTTYGSSYDNDELALVTGDIKLYQPGETINLSNKVSGDIVLKPVFDEVVAKKGIGDLTIAEGTFAEPVTYYTYTVNTLLDDTKVDIGEISLKSDSDIYSLSSDGNGTYKLTITEDKEFNILYNGKDSGLTVVSTVESNLELKSMNIKVCLDGSESNAFTSVKLVSDNGTIDMNQKYDGSVLAGQFYTINFSDKLEDSYRIFINNENTSLDIAPGDDKTINYRTAIITITGNVNPTHSVLRKDNIEIEMAYDSANNKLTCMYIESDYEFKLFVNGIDTEKTIVFNETDRLNSVEINDCTISIYKNDLLTSDESYIPTIDGFKMEKISTGVYNKTIIGSLPNCIVKGRTFTIADSLIDVKIYTVEYDLDGGIGTVPIDSKEYFKGDNVTLSTLNNYATTDGKEFVAWKYNDNTYIAGSTINNVDSKVLLKASYKSVDEYDILLSIDATNRYIMLEQLDAYLDGRSDNQSIGITVLKSLSLGDLNLQEKDYLKINKNLNVTINSLTTLGDVDIDSGSTVTVTNNVYNKLSNSVRKEFKVESDAKLIVKKNFYNNKLLTNYGTIDISLGILKNGDTIVPTSSSVLDGRAIINNNGTIILKEFENNAYFNNHKKITILDDPDDKFINNGLVTNNGGNIEGNRMENNNIIDNDNGEIFIDVYNFGEVESGRVITPKRIINPPSTMAENTFYLNPNDGTITYDGTVDYVIEDSGNHKVKYVPADGFTLPTNVTKEGFVFDGWYKTENYYGDKVTEIENDDESSLYFFAKWRTTTVASKPLVEKIEYDDGEYKGSMNAYCEVDTDNGATISGFDTVSKNMFRNSLNKIPSTYNDDSKTYNFKDFVFKISVKNNTDKSTTTQKAIKKILNEDEFVSFISIGLNQLIETKSAVTVNQISAPLEIIIPVDTTGKFITGVVRNHNNQTTRFVNSDAHTDGTYFVEDDGGNKIVHIFSDKFSEFAIVYQEHVANITADDMIWNYDGEEHSIQPIITNYAGADLSYSTDNGSTYTDAVTTIKDAGKIEVLTKATVSGKTVGTKDYTLEIAPRKVNYSALPSAISLTYDGTQKALVNEGTIATDSTITPESNTHIEYRLEGGTYSEEVPELKDAGSYEVYYKIFTDDNHNGGDEKSLTATIDKKEVTISGITANDKGYDGNNNATLDLSSATISGVLAEDADKLSFTATGTFDTKDIADGKTVTISNYVLTGEAAKNYKVSTSSQASTTAKINKKDITASITNNIATYGSTITNAKATLNGVASDDNVTVTYKYNGNSYDGTLNLTDSTDVPTKAGKYTVKISITDTKYNLLEDYDEFDFVVKKKIVQTPYIPTVVYDGKFHKPNLNDVTDVYEVVENSGGTALGKYIVKLKLLDNDNLRWSNVPLTTNDEDTQEETTLYFRIVEYYEIYHPVNTSAR